MNRKTTLWADPNPSSVSLLWAHLFWRCKCRKFQIKHLSASQLFSFTKKRTCKGWDMLLRHRMWFQQVSVILWLAHKILSWNKFHVSFECRPLLVFCNAAQRQTESSIILTLKPFQLVGLGEQLSWKLFAEDQTKLVLFFVASLFKHVFCNFGPRWQYLHASQGFGFVGSARKRDNSLLINP